jgi:hypothetical protein
MKDYPHRIPQDVYEEIFAPRGVSLDVAEARPYVPYAKKGWDTLVGFDPRLAVKTGAKKEGDAFAFFRSAVGQQPGLLMTRHEILDELEQPMPELRPSQPVVSGWGNPRRRKESTRRLCMAPKPHHHVHGCGAEFKYTKYVFPAGKGKAKRIDAHPWVRDLWMDTGSIFFELEGVLKADALLSRGYVALSVPSVTLWDGPDLDLILPVLAERDAVFFFTDSDWYTGKGSLAVCKQGRRCFRRMRAAGVNAFWAAPPQPAPREKRLGLDDYLGRGGSLGECVVIEVRDEEADLSPWFPDGNANSKRTDMQVLRWLRYHCTPRGDVAAQAAEITRDTGIPKRTVNDSLARLKDRRELVTIAKAPESWFIVSENRWDNTPTEWLILDRALIPAFEEGPLQPMLDRYDIRPMESLEEAA